MGPPRRLTGVTHHCHDTDHPEQKGLFMGIEIVTSLEPFSLTLAGLVVLFSGAVGVYALRRDMKPVLVVAAVFATATIGVMAYFAVTPVPDPAATIAALEQHYGAEISDVDALRDGQMVRVRLADGTNDHAELKVEDGRVGIFRYADGGELTELGPGA